MRVKLQRCPERQCSTLDHSPPVFVCRHCMGIFCHCVKAPAGRDRLARLAWTEELCLAADAGASNGVCRCRSTRTANVRRLASMRPTYADGNGACTSRQSAGATVRDSESAAMPNRCRTERGSMNLPAGAAPPLKAGQQPLCSPRYPSACPPRPPSARPRPGLSGAHYIRLNFNC